jgi:Flp pilus assembly protein TadB
MRNTSNLRVGDAERNAAASALGEHFAAGRLDQSEFDDRMEQALRARIGADLDRLFADLPQATRTVERPQRKRFTVPLLPLLLVTVGVMMMLPGEWSLFVLAGWLLLARYAWRSRVRSYRAFASRPRSHWVSADQAWVCGRVRHR